MPILEKRAAAALCLLLPLAAAAQAPSPIRFEKGKSSAVVQGTVPARAGEAATVAYTLQAAAGQTMTLRFTAGDPRAYYAVVCPGGGGTDAGASPWTFELPESGDYRITVGARERTRGVPFTLEVGVTGKPHPVKPRGVTGTWRMERDPDNEIEVRELPGGRLRFHLLAFWKGANWEEYGPNLGELSASVLLNDGRALYRDDDCELALAFSGDELTVTQQGSCDFGHNVSAAGVYRRSSLCAAPERFEGEAGLP